MVCVRGFSLLRDLPNASPGPLEIAVVVPRF